MEDAGTRNAIFVLRVITKRPVEMQKDIYMCFIDYAKAFDKVRHQELFEDLDKLDLYRKDVHLLAGLYLNQTACIQRDGEYSEYIKIKMGVRQRHQTKKETSQLQYTGSLPTQICTSSGTAIIQWHQNTVW